MSNQGHKINQGQMTGNTNQETYPIPWASVNSQKFPLAGNRLVNRVD